MTHDGTQVTYDGWKTQYNTDVCALGIEEESPAIWQIADCLNEYEVVCEYLPSSGKLSCIEGTRHVNGNNIVIRFYFEFHTSALLKQIY